MGGLADGQCYAGFKGGGLMLPNQAVLPIPAQPLVTLARAAESDWLSMELDEVFFGEDPGNEPVGDDQEKGDAW